MLPWGLLKPQLQPDLWCPGVHVTGIPGKVLDPSSCCCLRPVPLPWAGRCTQNPGWGVGSGEGSGGEGDPVPTRAETIRNTELEGTLGARTGEGLPEVPRGSSTVGGLGA